MEACRNRAASGIEATKEIPMKRIAVVALLGLAVLLGAAGGTVLAGDLKSGTQVEFER
jgi:hypothetical protein